MGDMGTPPSLTMSYATGYSPSPQATWRDYMRSIGGMENLGLNDKPLPPIPFVPTNPDTYGLHAPGSPYRPPPPVPPRPARMSAPPAQPQLHPQPQFQPQPQSVPIYMGQAHRPVRSAPSTPKANGKNTSSTPSGSGKRSNGTQLKSPLANTTPKPVIDLTGDSGSDSERDTPDSRRHRRAHSAQPRLQRIVPTGPLTPKATSTPKGASTPCAGFTRAGAPCKRILKSGTYCKDHAALICGSSGFYWRDGKGQSGIWIDFGDYIPSDLGLQAQATLRIAMEAPLTPSELPGFLYAYELRSLADSDITYFKVGRTDNVPRRMGQWSNQCVSHVPTLRDVFPLKGVNRNASVRGSLLPGAVKAGVDSSRMVPAVKRWERLVHLELADRSSTLCADAYSDLSKPCSDCGAIHKEIFPLTDDGGAYENIVVDAISRWEAFIRVICA